MSAAHESPRRWLALLAGLFSLVAASTLQYGLPFLLPTLRGTGLGLTAIAWLVSAPLVGLLSCLIAWGVATDRWGERWVLAAGLSGAGAALLAATTADDPWLLGVLLGVAGGSASAVQVASGRLILGWFSARERGLAMGVRQTGQPLGVGLAALTLPHLSPAAEVSAGASATDAVRGSLLFLAALSLVAAVTIALLARDPAHPDDDAPSAVSPYGDGYLSRLHLASALLVIPQFGVAAYAFDYLVTERGLAPGPAGALLALAQGGGAAIRLAAGWWSDRVGARLGPMRSLAWSITGTVALVGLLAAVLAPVPPVAAALVVAAVLVVSPNGLAFTAVAERAGRGWAGRATGVHNTGQNGVAALTAPMLAALIGAAGPRAGYPLAFLVLVLPAAAAALLIPVAREQLSSAAAAPRNPAATG